MNKTTQTVEIAGAGGAFPVEDVYPLVDGGRFPAEWDGIRLRIDPASDPALSFRCLA